MAKAKELNEKHQIVDKASAAAGSAYSAAAGLATKVAESDAAATAVGCAALGGSPKMRFAPFALAWSPLRCSCAAIDAEALASERACIAPLYAWKGQCLRDRTEMSDGL